MTETMTLRKFVSRMVHGWTFRELATVVWIGQELRRMFKGSLSLEAVVIVEHTVSDLGHTPGGPKKRYNWEVRGVEVTNCGLAGLAKGYFLLTAKGFSFGYEE